MEYKKQPVDRERGLFHSLSLIKRNFIFACSPIRISSSLDVEIWSESNLLYWFLIRHICMSKLSLILVISHFKKRPKWWYSKTIILLFSWVDPQHPVWKKQYLKTTLDIIIKCANEPCRFLFHRNKKRGNIFSSWCKKKSEIISLERWTFICLAYD